MNSKNHYELAASVRKGKVWLNHGSLLAVSQMYQDRIQNARTKLEKVIEQGRYATFRIDQALYRPQASKNTLQQMVSLLGESISLLLIFEAESRINTNRYSCLISLFREKQAQAEAAIDSFL